MAFMHLLPLAKRLAVRCASFGQKTQLAFRGFSQPPLSVRIGAAETLPLPVSIIRQRVRLISRACPPSVILNILFSTILSLDGQWFPFVQLYKEGRLCECVPVLQRPFFFSIQYPIGKRLTSRSNVNEMDR